MHEEETFVDDYRWFGQNGRRLHSKAVRGSGEVGFLVNEELSNEEVWSRSLEY